MAADRDTNGSGPVITREVWGIDRGGMGWFNMTRTRAARSPGLTGGQERPGPRTHGRAARSPGLTGGRGRPGHQDSRAGSGCPCCPTTTQHSAAFSLPSKLKQCWIIVGQRRRRWAKVMRMLVQSFLLCDRIPLPASTEKRISLYDPLKTHKNC